MELTQFFNLTLKICPICGKTFKDTTKPKNKKFCSKQCKLKNKYAKRYEKAKVKSLKNGELAKQKIKDKETRNKSLIKEFHQDDNKYGLGTAGNKLSEHPHPHFKKEYQLILESQLRLKLITKNEYYRKLKKFY